jgi:hypothetical protein
MQNSQLVTRIGGAITSLPICEGCILGKHHISNFPSKSNSRSTKLLELVHMDLCGPIKHQVIVMPNLLLFSLMTILDDYYYLFHLLKFDVFAIFQAYKALVEK